jgi:hypothetical protein
MQPTVASAWASLSANEHRTLCAAYAIVQGRAVGLDAAALRIMEGKRISLDALAAYCCKMEMEFEELKQLHQAECDDAECGCRR